MSKSPEAGSTNRTDEHKDKDKPGMKKLQKGLAVAAAVLGSILGGCAEAEPGIERLSRQEYQAVNSEVASKLRERLKDMKEGSPGVHISRDDTMAIMTRTRQYSIGGLGEREVTTRFSVTRSPAGVIVFYTEDAENRNCTDNKSNSRQCPIRASSIGAVMLIPGRGGPHANLTPQGVAGMISSPGARVTDVIATITPGDTRSSYGHSVTIEDSGELRQTGISPHPNSKKALDETIGRM